MDYIAKQKLKWRSRRSLLELDLYFDAFIQNGCFDNLDDKGLHYYSHLIEMEDEDLLLLLQGKIVSVNKALQQLIDSIKNAGISCNT